MLLENFRPQSKLVTKTTLVNKPKFPVIDAHNHLGYFGGNAIEIATINEVCDELDKANIIHYVDLDGGWGEEILQRHLDYVAPRSDRFQVFGGVDWDKWAELGNAFPEYAAKRLEAQKSWGARGLKIWKPFGLHVKDEKGELVKVDDERLNSIWETAGNLNLPVLAHVADPVAFFDPIDETNERWEEIGAHPDWAFTSPPFPPFMEILNGFKNVVTRHPATLFIGAHVGCYSENLSWVSEMLDACPNYYVDISARIGELGRQPYTARKFFIQHADRILFGLDGGPDVDGYRLTYRFLETDDEYFNYNTGEIPGQGRWYAYGMFLPDDVLAKVYYKNAAKLLKVDVKA
jgi:predicted TIM-barrel fold metal-dependent hydrolase